MSRRRLPNGIELRHRYRCSGASGGTCTCEPAFRAVVRLPNGGKLQKTFPTLQAAKLWREDVSVDLRRQVRSAPKPLTVREAAEAWLTGAKAGSVRNRSGHPYKPSSLRGYEQVLRDHVLPDLGGLRLTDLTRADVQALADRLVVAGHEASTVRNAIVPLRAICRRALVRGQIAVNPTSGLELPASRGRRDRIASVTESLELLAALPPADRPLWATALFAGLRRSELRALRHSDIDLTRGVIRVERGWDRVAGAIEPKSESGRRVVPIADVLRGHLVSLSAAAPSDLAFGRTTEHPFDPSTVSDRANRHWRAAGLTPITLHECRHTFASLMIAAGVNLKALQTFMGHASITITLDRYGHLMPGSEGEAAALLDRYVEASIKGPQDRR